MPSPTPSVTMRPEGEGSSLHSGSDAGGDGGPPLQREPPFRTGAAEESVSFAAQPQMFAPQAQYVGGQFGAAMAAAAGAAGGGEQYQGLQQVSPTMSGMQPEMPMTSPGVGMPMYADPAFMAQQAARGQNMGVLPGMYGVAGAIPTPCPMSGQQSIRLAMTPTPESRFDQYD